MNTTTTATTIINHAEAYCAEKGARFTDPRRFVLEIMAQSDKAMTAYDILDAMGAYLDKPKPPTAYRAIEFWQEQGFIHRIESLNAYILCKAGHTHQGSQFLICDECGSVTEAHLCHLPEGLKNKSESVHFQVTHWSVELHGRCAMCSASA